MIMKRAWSDEVKYIPRYKFFWHFNFRESYPIQPNIIAFKAPFLFFFPTANVYQTCTEHANITDQIQRKTGCCLQHISCSVALRDVKWRLQPSCFKGTPYPKCESNLLELLNVGSAANCRGFPTSPLYGRAASRFCREGGLKTPDQTAGVLS